MPSVDWLVTKTARYVFYIKMLYFWELYIPHFRSHTKSEHVLAIFKTQKFRKGGNH